MGFIIGQGVRDAIAANNDDPRSDEEYHGSSGEGTAFYSLTQGRAAMYRWTPQDGVRIVPFE